jgi:DDE superfamily endonuclease
VTTVWADEHLYYPLHACPYTPAHHFPKGKNDPAFRTKPQIAADLVRQALGMTWAFAAVVADCAYGDNEEFRVELRRTGLPYVVALKPNKGTWAREDQPHTPVDAARALAWNSPEDPGAWTAVERLFRDGHTEIWWAADATLAGWGADRPTRLVVVTTDPATLPEKTTWYLTTDLPRPGGRREKDSPHRAVDYAEIVRLYGLRTWVEQSYKQIKDELGWADFQVRSDAAIRRHQSLVTCAFSFCWRQWFLEDPGPAPTAKSQAVATDAPPGGQERGARDRPGGRAAAVVAARPAGHPQLADPGDHAHALVAGLVECAPTG